jgi:hypothetical protein
MSTELDTSYKVKQTLKHVITYGRYDISGYEGIYINTEGFTLQCRTVW